MDEAYTGSTIEDGGGDSEYEDNSAIDVADPLFLELLKDENDGIAVCYLLSCLSLLLLQFVLCLPVIFNLKTQEVHPFFLSHTMFTTE